MKDKTKKIAVGAIIAAIAGYIAGLLTAPKSGKETRKDISDKAIKTKTEAEKTLKHLHSELDSLLTKATTQLKQLKSSASKEFIASVATAKLSKEKAREILSALHDGDADDKDLQKAVDQVKKSLDSLKKYLAKDKPAS